MKLLLPADRQSHFALHSFLLVLGLLALRVGFLWEHRPAVIAGVVVTMIELLQLANPPKTRHRR